ncbi:ATP-dependent DNA helicase RecG [Propionibacteriaceae bacterium Y2011]|uniref:ATP-dependent DNA helicase RecG n=1 Tax=Microlunatus sp. Y2014 TaxID=3418488 RepID=UPI003B446361
MGDWRTTAYRQLSQKLDGLVGEKTAGALAKMGLLTVGDLVNHLPRRWLSGADESDVSGLRPGDEVAVLAHVARATVRGAGRKQRLEVYVTDGNGTVQLTFFGRPHLIQYYEKQLVPGVRGIFAGKVSMFRDQLQFAHPDFVIVNEQGVVIGGAKRNETMAEVSTGGIIGLYPATKDIRTWTIAQAIGIVLDQLHFFDPWPEWVRDEADVIGLLPAFEALHRPETMAATGPALDRLRFDEAFKTQLVMAYRRADAASHRAIPRVRVAGRLLDTFDADLPYELTRGQVAVGEQIFDDLTRDRPMQRLLQGEVGSGKTLAAVRAMLAVIDAGGQAVLLAPTEVLAAQHARSIELLLGDLALGGTLAAPEHATKVVSLTGSMPAKVKRQAMLDIASGEAGIVVGTHALLSENVTFAELGLIVIDEQHRFGVEQRAALVGKAEAHPHLLVMTATPIPRTVAMTIFGDLAVSTLTEIPAGRSEVSTVVVDEQLHRDWVVRAWQRIVEEVALGRQAFVVCPRISSAAGSEDGGRGVVELYEELTAGPLSSLRVGLLHGQLPGEEKDQVMRSFAAGELDVLVATTVVEVGVDVPNASVMVISDADRFGVSQLHQLRGRIGRGEHPGVCLLLTEAQDDTPARQRLDAVAATRDGFELAEVDLEQRREGDVLGAAQSGVRSSLRLLRVLEHGELIEQARAIAVRAVAEDPDMITDGFADAIREAELRAHDEWLDRT